MESAKDKIKALMQSKINSGYKLVDKQSCLELQKACMVELKLKKGNWGFTKTALQEILKERNLQIPDENPSSQIGTLQINVPTPPRAPAPPIAPAPPEAPKVLDVAVEKNNQAMLREGFSFIGDIYSALGIIKGKEKELPFEEMNKEQWQEKASAYADRVGSYCFRHNIEIPWLIEVLSLFGTGVIIFVIPLIKTFYMKTEKDVEDESLKGNSSKIEMEKQNESD